MGIFFLFLIEWFLNHPALRYGGYCLIVILFFYPFSLFLQKYDNSFNEIKYKFICLILIVFLIFLTRNIMRLNDEINKYAYKPTIDTYYNVELKHFRIDKKFKNLIDNFNNCENGKDICKKDLKPRIKKIFKNNYLFVNDK